MNPWITRLDRQRIGDAYLALYAEHERREQELADFWRCVHAGGCGSRGAGALSHWSWPKGSGKRGTVEAFLEEASRDQHPAAGQDVYFGSGWIGIDHLLADVRSYFEEQINREVQSRSSADRWLREHRLLEQALGQHFQFRPGE